MGGIVTSRQNYFTWLCQARIADTFERPDMYAIRMCWFWLDEMFTEGAIDRHLYDQYSIELMLMDTVEYAC